MSLTLSGCATSTPPPVADLAIAGSTIDDAEHNGAVEFAPIQLQAARDKLAAAQQAVRDDDNKRAVSLAYEAKVEAKLAQVTAESGHAQKSAGAVQQTVDTLHTTADQNVSQ
jgi:hypothetical protein